MRLPCIRCKGNNPEKNCGRIFCPIVAKTEAMLGIKEVLTQKDIATSSPAPFVGRFGYPNINVGILAPATGRDSWKYDAPRFWAQKNLDAKQIIGYRSSLINSRFKTEIRSRNKFLQISQEIGMASRPVDIEINLKERPIFRIGGDDITPPMGPNARLEGAQITSNPLVSKKVEAVVSDVDWKANDALLHLYKKGFDENFLTKLLSIGNVGVKASRKLVPTRWAITAIDDLLAKKLIWEIKQYSWISTATAYFGGYMGNYYAILLFPDAWSYELFETYLPNALWNQNAEMEFATDFEPYDGRKGYAAETSGGYYAARVPIAEKLREQKRQAAVLALRFITGEYAVPLGVWVCREAVRKALQSKPIEFADDSYMLVYATALAKKKFGCNICKILKQSRLLKRITKQAKLDRFYG